MICYATYIPTFHIRETGSTHCNWGTQKGTPVFMYMPCFARFTVAVASLSNVTVLRSMYRCDKGSGCSVYSEGD